MNKQTEAFAEPGLRFPAVVHLTAMLRVVTQKLAHVRKITLAGAHEPHAGIESQLRPGAEGLGAQQEFLPLFSLSFYCCLSLSSLLLYRLWAENARKDKRKVASVVIMEKHTHKHESSIIHMIMVCVERALFPLWMHYHQSVKHRRLTCSCCLAKQLCLR